MSWASRFWDRHAEGYAKSPVSDEESYRKKLEMTRDYLGPEMSVLEFGCGTGSTAIAQAPYARHILGIDISAKMLEIARRKAEAGGIENVTFQQGGIEDFEAADGSYDLVMGHSILHLLADRDAAIAKVYRLLKPGGVFVSSTVCLGEWQLYFRFAFTVIVPLARVLTLLPLVKVFTGDDLARSLTAAGFATEVRWQPGPRKAVFFVVRKPG